MIVFPPETRTIRPGEVRIAARVEHERSSAGLPEELFFEVPELYQDAIGPRSDAFLASLVLPAMNSGEDLEIHGAVSPRLASGVEEYQGIFQSWFPQRLRVVDVRASDGAVDHARSPANAVGTAFSGGIDSFYTLRSHRREVARRPQTAITHALLVHGFDIPLDDRESFAMVEASYREMLARHSVTLIPVRTNAASFAPPHNWGVFHGAPLIGSALLLGRLLGRFYVPASHALDGLVPWGSDPRVDHLLSTETLAVVHDGATTRLEKAAIVGGWPETFGRLRICPEARALDNCCRCPKCLRTMAMLDLHDVLALHPTFPLPLERRAVRRLALRTKSEFTFARSLVGEAVARRRWDIVADFSISLCANAALRALRRARVRAGRVRRWIATR